VLLVLLAHLLTDSAGADLLGIVPGSAWVVVPPAIGTTVRVNRESAARERAELVRRHVDEERLRVAREVHDVVGHGLAAINMQANVALHVRDRDPVALERALTEISRSSEQALEELRSTLAVVRSDDKAARAPSAGLDQVDELVRRSERPASGSRCRSRDDGRRCQRTSTSLATAWSRSR
jgi:signal transduction histidine kinase